MSAWFVGKPHVDVLTQDLIVSGSIGPDGEPCTFANATTIGRALWDECRKSLISRYPNYPDEHAEMLTAVKDYAYEGVEGPLDPAIVATLIASYQYQSCEHDGWDASWAYRVTSERRSALGRQKDTPHWGGVENVAEALLRS